MSDVGPGSGVEFFEELASWELFPQDGDSTIMDCEPDEVLEFAEALWMSAPFVWQGSSGPFSFIASASLHGCLSPYWNADRRAERARHLARFGALYADQVVIPDPLSVVFEFPEPLTARIELVDNLLVLKQLRPLVEAGIVVFGPRDVPVCVAHQTLFEEHYQEQADIYRRALEPVKADLSRALRDAVRDGTSDQLLVETVSAQFDHTIADAIAHLGVEGLRGPPDRTDLIADLAFRHMLDDMHYQAIMSWLGGYNYLTARSRDLQILRVLNRRPPTTTDAVNSLVHTIPFLEGMDTELLLKLRAEEGEAFHLYRERVSQAARAASRENESRADEILADLVRPELARLDVAVANARKMASRRVRENLVFGTGVVAIGVGTGLVAPQMQAVLTALGGLKFGSEILAGLNEMASEPPEVRDSDLYFLWRAARS